MVVKLPKLDRLMPKSGTRKISDALVSMFTHMRGSVGKKITKTRPKYVRLQSGNQ
jgi:hypothetical protein